MTNMIKKYVPFAVIIAIVYMLCPLFFVFTGTTFQAYTPIIYDIVFPLVAIICSIIYGGKYGIDFFFSLVAPIIYIPSMLIYNGISTSNIILVAIYLVSSILGLFLGDMFFGSKRNQEEPPLDVDLDIEETDETIEKALDEESASTKNESTSSKKENNTSSKKRKNSSNQKSNKGNSEDDFIKNYSTEKNTNPKAAAEDEIDKILKELHNKD